MDGYTSKLKTYSDNLHSKLSAVKCYSQFKSLISEEINSLELNDWAYSQLDQPKKMIVDEYVGTVDRKLIDLYISENFHEFDLMLQYVRKNRNPLFQSEIETYIKCLPYSSVRYERYEEMLKLNKTYGLLDTYCIPLQNKLSKGRFLLSLTSKGMRSEHFKERAIKNTDYLSILGLKIDMIGTLNFPKIFIDIKNKHNALSKSLSYRALIAIAKENLSYNDVADSLEISLQDVHNKLEKLRKILGTNTDIGSYNTLLKSGYLS